MPNLVCGDTNNKLCLHADVANLLVSGKCLEEIENSAGLNLETINNFFVQHQLLLNFSKTNYIQFHTKQSRINSSPLIALKDKQIVEVKQTKFLGVTIDNCFSWDAHIEILSKKTIVRHFCSVQNFLRYAR